MEEGINVPEGSGGQSAREVLQAAPPPAVKRNFLIEYVDEIRRGFKWIRVSPKPAVGLPPRIVRGVRRWWTGGPKSKIAVGAVAAIVLLASTVFAMQAANTPTLKAPGGGPGGPGTGPNNFTQSFSDTVGENSQTNITAKLNSTRLASLVVTLSWTDEPAPFLLVNLPDSLGLKIVAPSGVNFSTPMSPNTQGGSGTIKWSLEDTSPDWGGSDWQLIVVGGTMGDIEPISGRPGPCLRCASDSSNAFTLKAEYSWP